MDDNNNSSNGSDGGGDGGAVVKTTRKDLLVGCTGRTARHGMEGIRKKNVRPMFAANEHRHSTGQSDAARHPNAGLSIKNRRLKAKDDSMDEPEELFPRRKDLPEPSVTVLDVGSLDASSRNMVFLQAAQAFSLLQHRDENSLQSTAVPEGNLDLSTSSDLEVRFLFELAYSTLKYQELLSDLLSHCGLYEQFPELEKHNGLVMLILNDLINNSFEHEKRPGSDVTDPLILKVKRALCSCQTKISARLARHRIRANALTVDSLLPEQVRFKDRISTRMNAYIWVNQLKTSIDEVVSHLFADGFTKVDAGQVKQGNIFAIDHHCYDVIVFPPGHTSYLLQSPLYKEGKIILQDKSSCIAPHSLTPLVKDDDDVMHVNIGSGLMTAHISSLLAHSKCRIWGLVNDSGTQEMRSMQKRMEELDAKNVKIVQESLLHLSPDDSRFKSVKVVLLTANCSKSALNNPVDFVVNEGEDMSVLKRLSRGGATTEQLQDLYSEEVSYLKQTLQFPNVHAVIYLTRSVYELENEAVVSNVVEYVNTIQQPTKPSFRIVPPVLQFNANEIENNVGLFGKYIKFDPSDGMNGCFLAIIAREMENKKKSLGFLCSQNSPIKTGVGKSNTTSNPIRNTATKNQMNFNDSGLAWPELGSSREAIKPLRAEKDEAKKQRNSTDRIMSQRFPTFKAQMKSQGSIPRPERLYNAKITKQSAAYRTVFLSEHKKIINHPKPFR